MLTPTQDPHNDSTICLVGCVERSDSQLTSARAHYGESLGMFPQKDKDTSGPDPTQRYC